MNKTRTLRRNQDIQSLEGEISSPRNFKYSKTFKLFRCCRLYRIGYFVKTNRDIKTVFVNPRHFLFLGFISIEKLTKVK